MPFVRPALRFSVPLRANVLPHLVVPVMLPAERLAFKLRPGFLAFEPRRGEFRTNLFVALLDLLELVEPFAADIDQVRGKHKADDRRKNEDDTEQLSGNVHREFPREFVTFIIRRVFRAVKKRSFFSNPWRGGICDWPAVAPAMKTGNFGG